MHSTPPTTIGPPNDKAVAELLSPERLNPMFRNRIAHHEGIWHLPIEARWDDIRDVLGFIAPAAAAWVAGASRVDDVLARRP